MQIEIIACPVDHHGNFAVRFAGETICQHTRQPALDGARQLLSLGHDRNAILIMWRDGVPSVTGRLGHMAGTTVEDRPGGGKPPRFVRHRPMRNWAEGSQPIVRGATPDQLSPRAAE